jgi:ATP-dependent DNA helicase RecG
MIVHRDYRSPSESCVKVFADHIEFFNPGKLPDDISVNDLLSNHYLSTLRNKAIANHFHQLGEIEKYGSGITRVIKLFHEAGLEAPKFEVTGTGVKVTVWTREVADKPTTNEKVVNKADDKPTINDVEKQIIDYIKNNGESATKEIAKHIELSITQTKEYLYRLVRANLLQALGANRNKTYRLNK